MERGTKESPLFMKLMPESVPVRQALIMGLLALAPVAVAILMQNPALRQSLKMKGWDAIRKMSKANAGYWRKMEMVADHHYDLARL